MLSRRLPESVGDLHKLGRAGRDARERRAIIARDAAISVASDSCDASGTAELDLEAEVSLASLSPAQEYLLQVFRSSCACSWLRGSAVVRTQEVVLVGDIGGTNCRLVLWKIYPGRYDEILFSKVSSLLAFFSRHTTDARVCVLRAVMPSHICCAHCAA